MEKNSSTVHLIYPQWQGASVANQIAELKDNPSDASRGYYLGA